ncbi:MAG TPA: hypothetical protein PLO89_11155 [Spirochaetota bacterium]|nr:hypothetical protein [Spirochaetota bacterium]
MVKKFLILFLLFNLSFHIFGLDLVVNRIIYKKILIDFDQTSLINVFLNPMNVSDVEVYFNGKEVKRIYKNLKSLVKNDDNYFPSFNFEVSDVKKSNNLQIVVTLSQGMALTSEFTVLFEKGFVVDDLNFQTKKNRIFFIKAVENMEDNFVCQLKIENPQILEKTDETIKDNALYYKIKALTPGVSKLEVYKYDENLSVQEETPFKTFKITVVDD